MVAATSIDPMQFIGVLWPQYLATIYKEQRDTVYSVRDNDETVVCSGNELGKDFIAALIALWYYLCHNPVRIVVTSVSDDHLRVFFGELDKHIAAAKYPLVAKRKRDEMVGYTQVSGGPLLVNHRDIRKFVDGKRCPTSYIIGKVSERGEGLQGHHAPYTMFIADEASGIDDVAYNMAQTWAKKMLIFGNPLAPRGGTNFFYRAVKGGDVLRNYG